MPFVSFWTCFGDLWNHPIHNCFSYSLFHHCSLLIEIIEIPPWLVNAQAEVDACHCNPTSNTRCQARSLHCPVISALLHTLLDIQILHQLPRRWDHSRTSITSTFPLLCPPVGSPAQSCGRHPQSIILHRPHRTLLTDTVETSRKAFEFSSITLRWQTTVRWSWEAFNTETDHDHHHHYGEDRCQRTTDSQSSFFRRNWKDTCCCSPPAHLIRRLQRKVSYLINWNNFGQTHSHELEASIDGEHESDRHSHWLKETKIDSIHVIGSRWSTGISSDFFLLRLQSWVNAKERNTSPVKQTWNTTYHVHDGFFSLVRTKRISVEEQNSVGNTLALLSLSLLLASLSSDYRIKISPTGCVYF